MSDLKGGYLPDWDGQYDSHVWVRGVWITLRADAAAYRRMRTCDYGWDVGNLHVIDYRLWLADIPIRRFAEFPQSLHHSHADWSR